MQVDNARTSQKVLEEVSKTSKAVSDLEKAIIKTQEDELQLMKNLLTEKVCSILIPDS